ncbi:thioredoxin [Tepidamorphus gemmatus]|jgi:putative thioredoxin|uniref:Thioredoxin n=1 Tax=Tepidamorphus gemmatus TaxID=747076 RepID=A0A4R3MDV9_9HYPH|nr:thioredoxin [Tepidamorphus gemmatus]TCT11840.1 thioredoxin [Tepidamorphus gemmatus]
MDLSSLASGGAQAGAADGLIKDTTTRDFMKDVVEASRQQPVIVDFWAPWCGPCRQLTPVLEKLVRAARGAVKLVKMNIDEHPAVAQQMGVQSIPAVFAFVDGRPADGFMGALPESQVKAFIDRLVGPARNGLEEVLSSAAAAFAEGDVAGAAEIYAAVLQEDRENLAAIGGLVRCLVASGELDRAKATLALVPPGKDADPAIAGARAALELAEQTAGLGDPRDLAARVAANPDDHQARFDLALVLNAKGDREDAVEHLLHIIRRNRAWNDEAARKQLVQFFEAWGPKDPLTIEARRRLSSILFA